MASQSASNSSSSYPANLSPQSGEPSDSGFAPLTDLNSPRTSSMLRSTVSTRTRSKVMVIDPLEAEIVSKPSTSHQEVNSPIGGAREFGLVNLSSSTDEGEKGYSPSYDDGFLNHAEQAFFDNADMVNEDDYVIEVKREAKERLPSCETVDSTMNAEKLEKLLSSWNPGCKLVLPEAGERCHRFDNLKFSRAVPQAVLSSSYFKLGFSMPMHPFFLEILNFYSLAPMQLTPNSFRVAACMFILYDQAFSTVLTARELGYFYQLKDAGRKVGVYYLTAWNNRQGQCIKGNKRGMYDWQEQFLYCFDCKEIRKDFNLFPSKSSIFPTMVQFASFD